MSYRSISTTFVALLCSGMAVTLPALATVTVAPPIDPDQACPDWRWIGIKDDPDQPCPPAPTPPPGQDPWQVRHLFVVGDTDLPPVDIPAALRPYCLYQHPGSGADLTRMVAPGQLAAIDRDCLAVAPAAVNLAADTWSELSQHFLHTAGSIAHLSGAGTPVRLAIIDTLPTLESAADQVVGSSPHGYSLANMARRLLTLDSGTCAVKLSSQLALAYLSYDLGSAEGSSRDELNGGYLGTLGDLAKAISEAVQRSEEHDPAQHLVLHLAVAWDGLRFGGWQQGPAQMPLPVRAVHTALTDAVCRGALVVAAAGNAAGGPQAESGPLLPGGWETLSAPDAAACGVEHESRPSLIGQPLLWAAGGVSSLGQPLRNSRHAGMPRCVAMADHAVVESHLPGMPTATLTGSSVATTVIAAAASAVWFLRPELDRFEVMELVYGSGEDLGQQADFCVDAFDGCPQYHQHRISVCRALAWACDQSGASCGPSPLTCPSWWPQLPDLQYTVNPSSGFGLEIQIDSQWAPAQPIPACSPETVLTNPSSAPPSDPCPHRQYHGQAAAPWVHPQPGSNPCPNCLLSIKNNVVVVQTNSSYAGTLENLTLQINNDTYCLAPSIPGGTALISVGSLLIPPTAQVSVSFTVNGNQSVTSPILVID